MTNKHVSCLYCGAPIRLSDGKNYTVSYTDKNGYLTVEHYCKKDHAPDDEKEPEK